STTRQAPARRRRSTTESSGDALADQPPVALDTAPSGPSEVPPANPAEVPTSAGHAPDTAAQVRRGAAPEPSPAPSTTDTWSGLDVPGDEPAALTSERDADQTRPEGATPPAATPASSPVGSPGNGSTEPTPGAQQSPPESTPVPLDRAQEVAMWCRDAGIERDELCAAVSGGRTTSARQLTAPEAGQALDVARAVARGDAVASKNADGTLVVRRLGDVELRDQVLGLLQAGMEKRGAATTEIIGRAGCVRGDGPRGARVSTWAGTLQREQLLELGAELRKASPA